MIRNVPYNKTKISEEKKIKTRIREYVLILFLFPYSQSNRRTKAKTEKLLQILERQEWIDPRTRAVFTEFTLYNANVNLYASVIMGVEWMATGSAIQRTEVKV